MIYDAQGTQGRRAPDGSSLDVGTLRHALDLAIQNADGGDKTAQRAAAWEELARAHGEREPVRGKMLLTLEPGAFVQLGPGVYGFAPRVELPSWVPRQPHARSVGRALEGLVIALDAQAGMALLSPRLLALRHARAAGAADRRVQGTIVSASASGLVVDLDGARGFVPLTELPPDSLLEGAEPGNPWRGYVRGVTDTSPLLSQYPVRIRKHRARQREQLLAIMLPGLVETGRLISTSAEGALVAFADGLAWGAVPRAALHSPAGRRLARGTPAQFRILERTGQGTVALWLWPSLDIHE